MTSALNITTSVNPPRAVFLDFPLGHTAGKPHEPELNRRIMLDTLDAFAAMETPGSVLRLPYRWSDDDAWKETAQRGKDDRLPRYDTPQYQTEEDRERAEAHLNKHAESCVSCQVTV